MTRRCQLIAALITFSFDYAQNAQHLDGPTVGQTLPSALLWVWRGYPND